MSETQSNTPAAVIDEVGEEGARRWTIRHYAPLSDEPLADEHAKAEVTALLRDVIRSDGFVIIVDSLQAGEREGVIVNDAQTEMSPWDGVGQPTGYVTAWSAMATERLDGAEEITLHPEPGGTDQVVRFAIPDIITANGGSARLVHGFGAPVTCSAYKASGSPIGYLVASMLDDDIEVIELLPGAATVTVERDPEDEEDPS